MQKKLPPCDYHSEEAVMFLRLSDCIKNRVLYLLLFSETAMVRFWVGLASIGWSFAFMNTGMEKSNALSLMYELMPHYIWAFLFMLNGVALVVGTVLKHPHRVTFYIEPLLGLFLWGVTALSHIQAYKTLSPMVFSAIIFFWLLVRFPSKRDREREKRL